jgi:sialate O-acetylesterase
MQTKRKTSLLSLLLVFMTASLQAEVKIPAFFNDHMVLQRNISVPIWGWASPGEVINVNFGNQSISAKTNENGKWMLKLKPMEANLKGQTLTIANHSIKDVLVGEVWICSGQSNMQWRLGAAFNSKEEIAAAKYPAIRQ